MSQKNHITGVTGEYYVSAELGKQNILALTTPKNNPLFDLVAVSLDGTRSVFIQVKTMSIRNGQGWKLGKDIGTKRNNDNLYIVLVNLKEEDVEYYIYQYDTLSEIVQQNYNRYISTPKRTGDLRKDVGFRWHDFKYFTEKDHNSKNNWKLLGF
jgi:hypothetical protein